MCRFDPASPATGPPRLGVARMSEMSDLVEIERRQGNLKINVADAIGVDLDLDALEEMMEAMGEEITEQMEALTEELNDRYRDYADEFERSYRRARRNRR